LATPGRLSDRKPDKVGRPRKGRQARGSQADLYAGPRLCRAASGLACAPQVKLTRGWVLGGPPAERGNPLGRTEAQEGRGLGIGLNNRLPGTDAHGEQSPEVGLTVRSVVIWRHGRLEPLPGARGRRGAWDGGRMVGKPQEGSGLREEVQLRGWISTLKGGTPRAGPARNKAGRCLAE